MPKQFLSDEAKDALISAVRTVERRSAAEIVIAVRRSSGSPLPAAVIVGAAVAFAALAYLLFGDPAFGLAWILVDPFLAGLIAGAIAYRLPPVYRALVPRSIRSRWVRRAAEATFYEKSVRLTRERTGILIYVSLAERAACVLADKGILGAVSPAASPGGAPGGADNRWSDAAAAIDAAVAAGADGAEVARRIEALGDVLAPVLPRHDDDANELPDAVCA